MIFDNSLVVLSNNRLKILFPFLYSRYVSVLVLVSPKLDIKSSIDDL